MRLPDRKSLLLLMHAFVFRKLFYCFTVWSNTSNNNIKKLQLVQNCACRIVLDNIRKFDHISEGLRSLNWLSVKDFLFLKDSIIVYKCLNNKMPSYLSGKFTIHDDQVYTIDQPGIATI